MEDELQHLSRSLYSLTRKKNWCGAMLKPLPLRKGCCWRHGPASEESAHYFVPGGHFESSVKFLLIVKLEFLFLIAGLCPTPLLHFVTNAPWLVCKILNAWSCFCNHACFLKKQKTKNNSPCGFAPIKRYGKLAQSWSESCLSMRQSQTQLWYAHI